MTWPSWRLGTALSMLIAVLAGCGGGGSDDPGGTTWRLTMSVGAVTPTSVQLDLVANFGGPVPVWRDGHVIGIATLQGGSTVSFTDRDLATGTSYCYQAGGFDLLTGEIWSEVVCVTPG